MSCHAILIFYSVYQLYIKLVDSWASTINKRTSAVPETSIESFLRLKYSLLPFRCLMLLFVSLKFSPKYGLPNYRSGISVEFLAVKMTVSCLATDGRHLGSGLVTRQIRKKWAQNIILLRVRIMTSLPCVRTQRHLHTQKLLTFFGGKNLAIWRDTLSVRTRAHAWRHFPALYVTSGTISSPEY
jgi:hypothetical protein